MGRPLDEDIIIKILERWQKAFKENSHYVSASDLSLVIKDVRELPTIQSVATDTNVGDTISRQAAIDEIKSVYEWHDTVTMERLVEHFNNLPTIQPQSTAGQLNDSAQSTNLIDRQQAIDALAKQMPTPYTPDGSHPADEQIFQVQEVYADCITTIKLLPTIQPEPQWIPVSERLPEDLVEVNVTWVNRNPESYYEPIKDKPFTTTAVYYKGEWYWLSATCVDYLAEYGRCDWNKIDEAIEIIAWMPLPEPYNPNK